MTEYIYTSPDGGHTVYQQEPNKPETKALLSEDEWAVACKQAQKEAELCGTPEAVIIRKWHPALQDAWRQYQTLWELTITEKDWEEAHQLGLVESDVE